MKRVSLRFQFAVLAGILLLSWSAVAEEQLEAADTESASTLGEFAPATLVAQTATRRRTKKRTRRRRSAPSSMTTESSRPSVVQSGLKAGAGLVMGAEGDTPFILGADYTLPIGFPNLLLDFGGSYWTYSVQSASVTIFTIEGGADYHFRITAAGKLVGGARLTYVNASGGGASDSKFGLTILGGYEHNLGSSAFGAELRHPMVSDLDVNYVFGYYKFFL